MSPTTPLDMELCEGAARFAPTKWFWCRVSTGNLGVHWDHERQEYTYWQGAKQIARHVACELVKTCNGM